MNSTVTLEMIHKATTTMGRKGAKPSPQQPAKRKSGQSPLPFPVPVHLNSALANVQLFSNPPPPSPRDVETVCPAICALIATGGTTEEEWSLGIVNTSKFTDDPDGAVHAWSKAHPKYYEAETAQKLAEKEKGSSCPTKCGTIAALSQECASACQRCEYNGKATTPIHAAQKYAANRGALAAPRRPSQTPPPVATQTPPGKVRLIMVRQGSPAPSVPLLL